MGSWYEAKKSKPEPTKVHCKRCGLPVKQNKKKLNYAHKTIEYTTNLCHWCEKRDKELILAINNCIRLYGNMITVNEITDLFSNPKLVKALAFDPFAQARQDYRNKEALTLDDFDRWIAEGIFEASEDNRLSATAQKAREEIEEKIKAHEEYQIPPNPTPSNSDSDDAALRLSRRMEKGGASTGKERWANIRKTKE